MVEEDGPTELNSPASTNGVETRLRIRRAARVVVARRGFDATVDEIAAEADLSPRTVFRHYSSHDALIVDAVKDMFDACGRRPIEDLPMPSQDLDGWIEGLARTIHTRNIEIIGQAFWDIHTHHDSAILAEIRELREQYRVRGVGYLVDLAWRTAGGKGPPPEKLTWVFGLNFSVFTTQALTIDFCLSPADIGSLTARLIKRALREAVAEQACREDEP
jgi:AcrR family transcriptional regulator